VYGTGTSPSLVADFNLVVPARSPEGAPHGLERFQMVLGMRNLLDTEWATPAGLEHRQAAIQQDGRTVSVELRYRF
jgi:outer membrane receptor protein involved in Fe transport